MRIPNPIAALMAAAIVIYARLLGYKILADKSERAWRRVGCDGCTYSDGFQCEKCTCIIEAKIALNTESCPMGYWDRVWEKRSKAT